MEQKLAEFRARKARAQHESGDNSVSSRTGEPEPVKKTFSVMMSEKLGILHGRWQSKWSQEVSEPLIPLNTENIQMSPPEPDEDAIDPPVQPSQNSLLSITLLLKILIWLILLGLFVELEFGLAYFIVSMFYWLYQGTRKSGQKKQGEKSAYSVFNPGCEAIQGTVTAEQLQRELVFGPFAGI
ncbi:SAYSvFN domain-containing protein 1 [Discoglossus pictus]